MEEKTFKVSKGCHYGHPFFPKLICWKKADMCRYENYTYTFTDSCRYDIGEDQTDKNKLFGWSYGSHHRNSVRCTWWYEPMSDTVKLCLYVYEDGKCVKRNIDYGFNIGEKVDICLTASADASSPDDVMFCLSAKYNENSEIIKEAFRRGNMDYVPLCTSTFTEYYKVKAKSLSKWGYTLGLYFGGNRTAPHDITVKRTT